MKKSCVVIMLSLLMMSSCTTNTANGAMTGGMFGAMIGSAIGGMYHNYLESMIQSIMILYIHHLNLHHRFLKKKPNLK